MNKKPKDRHLDVPSEANRDKHINFLALERGETDPADEPPSGNLSDDDEKDSEHNQDTRKKRNDKNKDS